MEEGEVSMYTIKTENNETISYHFEETPVVGETQVVEESQMVEEMPVEVEIGPDPTDVCEVEVGEQEVMEGSVPEPETHVVIQDTEAGKEEIVVKIFPVVGAYEEIAMDHSGEVQQEVDVSCEEVAEDLDSNEDVDTDSSAAMHQYMKVDAYDGDAGNSHERNDSVEEKPLSRMFQETADRLKKRLEAREQDLGYFTKAGLHALSRQSTAGEGDGPAQSRKPFVCTVCHKGFSKVTKLNKHMQLHDDSYSFVPTHSTLDARAKLKQLLESEQDGGRNAEMSPSMEGDRQPVKTYLCGICFKAFSQEGRLNKHLKSHKGENTGKKKGGRKNEKATKKKKTFQCNICYKNFTKAGTLQKHMTTHETSNDSSDNDYDSSDDEGKEASDRSPKGAIPKLYEYECQVCDRTFDRPCNLKYHLYSHEETKHLGVPPPLHTCSICDRSFHRPYFLRRHMLTAHEIVQESPVRSKTSVKGSMRTSGLIAGALSPKKKAFRCEVCDKAFDRPCNLKYHLYSHKETRHMGSPAPVHICGRCGKEFNRPVLLRHHARYCTMPS